MADQLGQWRATYTPGDWIVLSGPTSLVILQPAPPDRSALIGALWEEVLASASIHDIATKMAAFRIDEMQSFGAFFWTTEGMRSLVRGEVRVQDASTGATIADGKGVLTWNEVGLRGLDKVTIDLESDERGEQLGLPLVVGAVMASSITLDASVAARVTSPQSTSDPAAARMLDIAEASEVPVGLVREAEWGQWGSDREAPDRVAEEQDGFAGEQDRVDGEEDGVAARQARMENADTELMGSPFAVPVGPPVVTPVSTDPESDVESMENADTQLMGSPLGSVLGNDQPTTQPMTGAAADDDSRVLASICPNGHSNAPDARSCRVCGTTIAAQRPQLVGRPVLASLRTSDGSTVELDTTVLIGRAPSAGGSDTDTPGDVRPGPRLLTVPSPSHDISRTHLQISAVDWQIVVTDLHSTNGTTLVLPGAEARERLNPGEAVPVPVNSILEVGDGVTVLVEPAQ